MNGGGDKKLTENSVLDILKKNDHEDMSSSDEDSDLESCIIDKIGLLIEKKFANIVIQGGQRPKKITRVDQVLDYSRVV